MAKIGTNRGEQPKGRILAQSARLGQTRTEPMPSEPLQEVAPTPPVFSSLNVLHNLCDMANAELMDLSARLSPIMCESGVPPANDAPVHASCTVERALVEACVKVEALTENIRAIRQALCI